MQSEGGAAGALHGALQAGALATTFTASQGLLLMIPNMYKIAGELTPAVIHIAAANRGDPRAVDLRRPQRRDGRASDRLGHARSSDVQEAQDLAADRPCGDARVPRAVPPLLRRLPHLARGRTRSSSSTTDDLRAHDRRRASSGPTATARSHPTGPCSAAPPRTRTCSSRPARRSTPSTPPCRTSCSRRWTGSPSSPGGSTTCSTTTGAPDAERVVVLMGSGAGAVERGRRRAGPTRARRSGSSRSGCSGRSRSTRFVDALPATAQAIAVLDRTKEPGAMGEPLYQDVVTALAEGERPPATGRCRGSSAGGTACPRRSSPRRWPRRSSTSWRSERPKRHFTVGIVDDVTHT